MYIIFQIILVHEFISDPRTAHLSNSLLSLRDVTDSMIQLVRGREPSEFRTGKSSFMFSTTLSLNSSTGVQLRCRRAAAGRIRLE